MQVKNPWRKKRWKGPFSANDTTSWTPQLREKLNFDPSIAISSDDGMFWIDYDSVRRHFRGLFLNWNPDLFSFKTTLHKHWPLDKGPRNDTYNVGYNPQYTLEVKVKTPKTVAAALASAKNVQSVWVLLTRHVTGKIGSEIIQAYVSEHFCAACVVHIAESVTSSDSHTCPTGSVMIDAETCG